MHISLHIFGIFALYMHIRRTEPTIRLLFQRFLLKKMHIRRRNIKNMQISSRVYAYFRLFSRIYVQVVKNLLIFIYLLDYLISSKEAGSPSLNSTA